MVSIEEIIEPEPQKPEPKGWFTFLAWVFVLVGVLVGTARKFYTGIHCIFSQILK